jgi:hypothetical protein
MWEIKNSFTLYEKGLGRQFEVENARPVQFSLPL